MLNKLYKTVFAVIAIALFSSSASAMQINLNLGDDFKNNKDQLNVYYDIFSGTSTCTPAGGCSALDITDNVRPLNGIKFENIAAFLSRLNSEVASLQPRDSFDGKKHSTLSLGYVKNGQTVSPASCQNILAKPVNNVTLTETGCAVS